MPYQVLVQTEGSDEWVQCFDGREFTGPGTPPLAIFDDGKAAADFRSYIAGQHRNARYTVRKIAGSVVEAMKWKARERERFESGQYRKPPWYDEAWYARLRDEHFAHLSMTMPGRISYTQDGDKGIADLQTPIRPGAYLKRYFGDVLSEPEIERWVAKVSAEADEFSLKITQDPDEIGQVYSNGPHSCMKDKVTGSSYPHQCATYGGPDLGVAYFGTLSKPKARCVVWPERKIRSNLYGDHARLSELLTKEGYKLGSFQGARLRRYQSRDDSNSFIMPYLDNDSSASDNGEFLVIDNVGDLESTTGGWATTRTRCDHCNEPYDDDDLYRMADVDQRWCQSCLAEDGFTDSQTGQHYSCDHTPHFDVRHGHNGCGDSNYDHYLESRRQAMLDDGTIIKLYGREYAYKENTFTCNECSGCFEFDDEALAKSSVCHDCYEQLDAEETAAIDRRIVFFDQMHRAGRIIHDVIHRQRAHGTPWDMPLQYQRDWRTPTTRRGTVWAASYGRRATADTDIPETVSA